MNLNNFLKKENEKPLDNLVNDGGFCSCLRTITIVGDSMASGETEAFNDKKERFCHDDYDNSWGNYLAHLTGCKVNIFGEGGLSAGNFLKHYSHHFDCWNAKFASRAYIICLGLNDFRLQPNFGSKEDICMEDYTKNAPTLYGEYAQIIQHYKEISPNAKFFLMTTANENFDETQRKKAEMHRKMIYEFSQMFSNTYVLDFYQYAPAYDEEFRKSFYIHGHLNPMGYYLTAKMVASYIDYIIRNNVEDFKNISLVTTPYFFNSEMTH